MYTSFDKTNFHTFCNHLAKQDQQLRNLLLAYGYPPLWSRKPGFATLIHIILEQQVSLASAKAAVEKLKARIGTITPVKVLALSDTEMKKCYFSRQKTVYARHLAQAVLSKQLQLETMETASDDAIRNQLIKIPGIGTWTVDVYMMIALHRSDRFPPGDVALMKSLKKEKGLPDKTSKEQLIEISDAWKPYRTIAAFILWHAYIMRKKVII